MRSISVLVLCLSVFYVPVHSIIIVKGNNQSGGATFAFPVKKIVEDSVSYLLYTAAETHTVGAAKEFALACVDQTTGICTPLAAELVTLNILEHNQPNPLYDNAFKDIAVMHLAGESLPVVLTQDNLNQLFMFESTFPSNISILQSAILNDAHLVPTPALSLSLLATDNNGHILTCTTPASGNFGDEGSGIALVVRGFKKENDTQVRAFQQVNAITGRVEDPPIAVPFDRTAPFLAFEDNPLVSLMPTSFWWDDALQRLYIGIAGTGPAGASAGIRAIAVARLSGHQLFVEEFVPQTAFDGNNNDLLIGKKGSNQAVAVVDLVTMHTSGKTAYLIVRGSGNTSNDIQVIPLVQSNDPALHGKAADKNSLSEDIFVPGGGNMLTYQKTVTPIPATTPEQLATQADPMTVPGGGIVLQGAVTSMKTVGDTLYATIDNDTAPELNGLYQTTAIIESNNGKIVGWTEWQPVLLPNAITHFGVINRKTGTINMLIEDNNETANVLLQTQWQPSTKNNSTVAPLNDFLQIASDSNIVQKFLYFPAKTPGILAGSCGVFLYQKSVALSFITHTVVNGIQRQTTAAEFASTQILTNDIESTTFDANTLFIKKDKLADIGIPTCACIAYATTTDDAWFVVGGTQGVALFSTSTGDGWSLDAGIGNNFVNLPGDYTTVHTRAIQNVQNISCVDGFLFILTDRTLMRLSLSPQTLLQAPLTTIAEIQEAPFSNLQSFTTLLTAAPVALLGTTEGLWINIPDSNITSLNNKNSWHRVLLPESGVSIEEFSVINKTGYIGDSTNNQGSTVYVYSKDQATKIGRINRLYCAPTQHDIVENNTIQLFNDRRLEKISSHILDLGIPFQKVQYNGNSFFSVNNKNGLPIATFSIAAPETADGHNPYLGLTQWVIPFLLHAPVAGFHTVAGHGSMIIADSQQLYVNQ
ncbi:MAG TPA: hypothetical protein VL201_00835 [Patescibacteria group bacterium]|jgi:hypothetical protein|nr:hypothetical protein [Patescibacteria group bacterium]